MRLREVAKQLAVLCSISIVRNTRNKAATTVTVVRNGPCQLPKVF